MDENAVVSPQNNPTPPAPGDGGIGQSSASTAVPQNPVPAVVASPATPPLQEPAVSQGIPSIQQIPQQPAQQENAQDGSSPRLTLEDLYGPSKQQSQQPAQPVLTPQPEPQTVPVEPPPVVQEPVIETQRRPIEPTMPIEDVPQQVAQQELGPIKHETTVQQKESVQAEAIGGGFHFPPILKFIVGGFILLIVILIIFGIGSIFFSGKNQDQNVTLNYWGLWENPNVMQPVLDDFHKQHPNITITYTKQDPIDYTKRLVTRMQEGDGPDLFTMHNTWIYPLQNILLPLPTSVVDPKQLSTNYPPVVTDDLVSSGAVYALPLGMDSLSLFVNTDILTHAGASVPTTWDNFITVAKALTVKDPDGRIQTAGAALGTYNNIAHAPDIISLLLLQNGANIQKLQNSSNATDALSFYTSFASGDSSVWDNTLDNSLLAFEKGKLAMYFGYSYDIFAIQAANPSLKFTVHPVPHLPGRDMSVVSYWAQAVSSRSKHQKEALEFMQYLAQKDTQSKLYSEEAKTRAFGELYARSDLAQQLTGNPLLAPFITQLKTAKSSFFVDGTDYIEYNGALNQYLGNAVNSMLKDTSADSASSTLAQGVAQVLGTYAPKTQ